ncbi:MAG: hypothetical protein IBJ15_23260, partial [Alphaproteobacteria bacterium]|nr:hypothetical protein [Alphaproteobacteria bacterium]
MTKTYISADWILPMADDEFAIADGAIVFENDKIVAVGKAKDLARHKETATTVRDLTGQPVMPGLVTSRPQAPGRITNARPEDGSRQGRACQGALA